MLTAKYSAYFVPAINSLGLQISTNLLSNRQQRSAFFQYKYFSSHRLIIILITEKSYLCGNF